MSSQPRLAIVGSTVLPDPPGGWRLAAAYIDATIANFQPVVVISGGAAGVDRLARRVAAGHGYRPEDGTFIEHLPANDRWAPDGFKARNQLVAQDCTHLLAIRARDSRTYGSGWTADLAQRLGRTVIRIHL